MVPLETLKRIQFMQDLSDDHLQQLAEMAEIKEGSCRATGGEVVYSHHLAG
jgi:hypothetical protein